MSAKNIDVIESTAAKKLLSAKNPEQYIDLSIKSKIPSGIKGKITKAWLEKTGFTVDDIEYARNRHPYWKELKGRGGIERNKERMSHYNFAHNDNNANWDDETIKKFLELNKKDKSGKYLSRDHELAEIFQSSIPTIQYWRRKQNLIKKILEAEDKKPTISLMIKYIKNSEKNLRDSLKTHTKTKRR